MKKLIITGVLAVAGLLAAGCGTTHTSTPAAAAPHKPAAAAQPVLASGPFKITPLLCSNHYTPAQVNQYSDYSGLVFRYINRSTQTAAPVLRVNFVNGSMVAGDNVNGSIPDIAPGQSAIGEVGAVGGGGNSLHFKSCQMVSYSVDKDYSGTTYQP
jgi:hypothetical protein